MNSNSLSSGPASIPDFAPLTDAFDMTPTPSEADAMSVRATVSMEVKANAIKNKKKKESSMFSFDWSLKARLWRWLETVYWFLTGTLWV